MASGPQRPRVAPVTLGPRSPDQLGGPGQAQLSGSQPHSDLQPRLHPTTQQQGSRERGAQPGPRGWGARGWASTTSVGGGGLSMPPLPRSHRPAVGVRRHSPGKGVLAGHAETARDLQGGCAVLASTGDRRQPLLRTLNRRPIIAPEALSKPPHWGPGLHSSLLAPRCREGGGMGGLPCPAPRCPSPPQARVKAQSEGLQPWASPGAGPLGAAGWGEGGGRGKLHREGGRAWGTPPPLPDPKWPAAP